MNDADLARVLVLVADHLERTSASEMSGIVRQAARRIVEGRTLESGCEGCGADLEQKPVGRRRRFCSERCRKRAGNLRVVS
jgi:hypothetical protein